MSEPSPAKKAKFDVKPIRKVFGICNPLLDISSPVPDSFLEKFELKRGTAILAEKKHLPIYDEILKLGPEYIAGGAGQNTIRVCQWMLHDHRGSTYYVGCVGKDKFGKTLRETVKEDGVSVHYMEVDDVPTGTCACLITDKERTLVANLSAAEKYKLSHFESEGVKKILDDCSVLYATGFFVTHSTDSLLALGEYANTNKKTFLLNLAAPFVSEFFKEQLNKVMMHADVIFGNEHEAQAYSKAMNYGTDIKEIAKKVQAAERAPHATQKRVVVFTQGSEATIVCDEEGKIHVFHPIKLPKEQIVDANGAGDAFVGGFLAAYAMSQPLEKCVKAAFYAAWEILQVSGTNVKGKKPKFQWD